MLPVVMSYIRPPISLIQSRCHPGVKLLPKRSPTMTTISQLREAKVLLSANKAAEAHKLIETTVYSLLDAENPRQAARVNLVFVAV
jgi:hypothetical protein